MEGRERGKWCGYLSATHQCEALVGAGEWDLQRPLGGGTATTAVGKVQGRAVKGDVGLHGNNKVTIALILAGTWCTQSHTPARSRG